MTSDVNESPKWRPETEAEATRALAEAHKFDAEARKFAAEADEAEHGAAVALLELERAEEKRSRERWGDAYADRTYRFLTAVGEDSVNKCIAQLNQWHREDANCGMVVLFDSPGGAVIEGFHLFDHILELRAGGHQVDTMTRGYAASMGGILLQAGEKRIMGPNATLMLHEVSFGTSGKIGDVEDMTKFAHMLQSRALDIFADRCARASDETATKRLKRARIKANWTRKDWWVGAADALAFGLVDEIR